MKQILIAILLLFALGSANAQTDFPALKQKFLDYRKADKQDSALFIARKMNNLALKEETDTSYWYALSMRYIGNPFNTWGNTDSTIYYWTKSVELFEKHHPLVEDYDNSLKGLAILYKELGEYKSAEPILVKSIEFKKKLLGENHPDYSNSLINLGNLYREIGEYRSAETKYLEAIDIRKKTLGENHIDYAGGLNTLAILYRTMGKFQSAEELLLKSLEIKKNILGEEDKQVAMLYNNLGYLYIEMAKYEESINLIQNAINIIQKTNSDSSKIINELHSIATAYNKLGKFDLAEKNYLLAIKLLDKDDKLSKKLLYNIDLAENKIAQAKYDEALILLIHQKELCLKKSELQIELARINYNLGKVYSKTGKLNSSLSLYKEALEIRVNYLESTHPDLAESYNAVGAILYKLGLFKDAIPYFKNALELRKKVLGEEHPDVASSINNLGVLYKTMGDYKAAEPLYKQALEIKKKTLGEEHPNYALSLINLGNLYSDMGDYKAAEPLYKQALELRKKVLGEEHPDVASSINNLGVLYKTMGDYKAAEPLYKQALEINKKTLGEEHPYYASSVNNLGILFKTMGDYKAAESLYKQALEIRKKVLGEEHPDYASSLNELGNLYMKMSDYKAAEPLYKQALEIKKKTLGEGHPSYVSAEIRYANLLTRTEREQQAFAILNKDMSKKTKQIVDNFEWLNDNQKEAYWKIESSFYDDLSWFASKAYSKVPEAVALNYNGALITKSKLLETKISKENYYIEVDEIREELSYRKKLLNKLESDGSDKKELMDKLRYEADSLDKQLELSWPAYAEQKRNLLITWDKVHQNLSDGEAAIEFVRFREDEDSSYQYQALIIRKDLELPVLAPLCFEKDLVAINPKSGFSAYYPLVWEPMEEHLKDIHTIYYAPSGELYNVPFHAIYAPQGNGDELVEAKTNKRGIVIESEHAKTEENASFLMDRYTLHQLTSTRYLALGLKKKEQEQPEASIAMVGGVNYDYLPGQETAKPKKGKATDRSSASANGKLSYLEGTKQEAEAIHKTLDTKSWNTTYLEGNNAKEENITKLTGKEAKGILHIATHGYAFPEYSSLDTTIKENSLRYSYRFSQNPMVRSGLILTGGNWAWTGSDTLDILGAEENGILTALEVSGLNLRNTKLVVLSACETGLGKIEGSEGTFGLKRGFKLAGVEQMIVSLWSVPDKETMELMTLFYEDLSKTLNPVSSFQNAQKQMRDTYPNEPYKWAGFVLVR